MTAKKKNEETEVESTEVAVKDDQAVALPDYGDMFGSEDMMMGLESVDRSDLKLPGIKLLQSNSEEVTSGNGRPGQFLNQVSGETVDAIDAVILQLGKSRVLWPPKFKRGDDPLCLSLDSFVGEGEPGGECKKCPKAQWGSDNEVPDCRMNYTLLCLQLDGVEDTGLNKAPFRLIGGRGSIRNIKNFINQVMIVDPQKAPIMCRKVRITSEQESNDSGTFFVLKIAHVGWVTRDQALSFKGKLESLSKMFLQDQRKEIAYGDHEDLDNQVGDEEGDLV